MRRPSPDAAWRDSARTAKFWLFDAYAVFPVLLALYNIQYWTMGLAVAVMSFLTILGYYGFTIRVFGRLIRSFVAGPRKNAVPWWS